MVYRSFTELHSLLSSSETFQAYRGIADAPSHEKHRVERQCKEKCWGAKSFQEKEAQNHHMQSLWYWFHQEPWMAPDSGDKGEKSQSRKSVGDFQDNRSEPYLPAGPAHPVWCLLPYNILQQVAIQERVASAKRWTVIIKKLARNMRKILKDKNRETHFTRITKSWFCKVEETIKQILEIK